MKKKYHLQKPAYNNVIATLVFRKSDLQHSATAILKIFNG